MAGYVYRGYEPDPVRPVAPLPRPKPGGGRPREPFDPAKCGTYAGHQQHVRHGTPKCEPCRVAQVEYQADYRARQRRAA